jgi:hypothetical protein
LSSTFNISFCIVVVVVICVADFWFKIVHTASW